MPLPHLWAIGYGIGNSRRHGAAKDGGKYRYEFEFCPVNGFLSSPDLLMTDCELKLSYES